MPASITIRLNNWEKGTEIKMEYHAYRKMVLILRSVNHPLRHQIIRLLQEKDTLNVGGICQILRNEQSVISQHLAILRRTGVVATQREGKFVWYFLVKERLSEIGEMINALSLA